MQPSDYYLQLTEYIKLQLSHGTPEAQLRQQLLAGGWQADWVDAAFASLQPNITAPVAPAAPTPPPTTVSPQKYRVFVAIRDTFRAAKQNILGIVAAAAVSVAFTVATLLPIAVVIGMSMGGIFSTGLGNGGTVLAGIFGALLLYLAWYAFVYALFTTTLSLALQDGRQGRKSVLKNLAKESLRRIMRVTVANVLLSLIMFGPYVVFTVVLLMLVFAGVFGGTAANMIIVLGGLGTVVWMLIAFLRYALMPYVALFEPDLPITKTAARSFHLLRRGGQWFVFKGIVLLFAIILILAVVSGQTVQETSDASSSNMVAGLIIIFLSILSYGVLAMLYFNRKIIRG